MEPTGEKEARQTRPIHGRMGLGTACKGETVRMKNVSIESSGAKKICLWVEEKCVFTEKFTHTHTHTHIYIYILQDGNFSSCLAFGGENYGMVLWSNSKTFIGCRRKLKSL
jgi:hypothetical protein